MNFQKLILAVSLLFISPLFAAETDATKILNYCKEIAKKLDCSDVQFNLEQAILYSAGSYNPFTQTILLSKKTQCEILTNRGDPINNGVFTLFHELGHHYSRKKKNLFGIALTSLFYKQWEENNADRFAIEMLCKEYGKDAIGTLLYEQLSSTHDSRDVMLSLMGYLTPQQKIDYLHTIATKEELEQEKSFKSICDKWAEQTQAILSKGLAI